MGEPLRVKQTWNISGPVCVALRRRRGYRVFRFGRRRPQLRTISWEVKVLGEHSQFQGIPHNGLKQTYLGTGAIYANWV